LRNIAIVLSGGTGIRMGMDCPKQYIKLAGKPVIVHTLEQLQHCKAVDGILVAASPMWEEQILQWKDKFALEKLLAVVSAGKNRQLSLRNGLMAAKKWIDHNELSGVLVQDAVRPLASAELLTQLIEELRAALAVMPVLPITDTAYTSRDGQWVDGLLDRSTLFAGQAPEAFRYWPYMELYRDALEETLSTMSGSCQLPYSRGWQVKMIPGDLKNIKITYLNDLQLCERLLKKQQTDQI